MFRTFTLAASAAASLLAGTAARAQDAEESWPKLTGGVTLASDYRFRGVSLSNRDPAVQPTLTLTTKPGFFIGVWGSNIAEYGGAKVEVDVYGGWSGPVGPLTATVGVYSYLYPGGRNVDVYELYGSLAGTLGPLTTTVGINYAPDQSNLATDSRYLYANFALGVPNTPVTLKANVGHEQGSFVVDATPLSLGGPSTRKVDFLLGADIKYEFLTLGLAYIGNDQRNKTLFNPNARNRFVVTLTASF